MKKMMVLSLAVLLVLGFSLNVFAEGKPTPGVDDPEFKIGEGIFENYENFKNFTVEETDIKGKYKVISGARTTGTVEEIKMEQGDQEVKVIINTLANIPCYIEMELIGNAGWSRGVSFGAGAEALMDRTGEQHWMLFHSDFGGFLNENWESVAQEDVNPGSDLYLHACDMWEARIYANIDYKLDVIATPLEHVEYDEEIQMDMRHTLEGAPNWDEENNLETATIGPFNYLEENTVLMQFRVPFDDVPAGHYEGDITFRAYSI